MPVSRIRCDYAQLAQIAQTFGAQADALKDAMQRLKANQGNLVGGDWIGEGARKFYDEMNTQVMPAMQRLVNALQQAQQVTGEISRVVKQAEDDAAACFNLGDLGVAPINTFAFTSPNADTTKPNNGQTAVKEGDALAMVGKLALEVAKLAAQGGTLTNEIGELWWRIQVIKNLPQNYPGLAILQTQLPVLETMLNNAYKWPYNVEIPSRTVGGNIETVGTDKEHKTPNGIAQHVYGVDSYQKFVTTLDGKPPGKNLQVGDKLAVKQLTLPPLSKDLTFEAINRLGINTGWTAENEGNLSTKKNVGVLKPSAPLASSGVSLGAGYDLAQHTEAEVRADLKEIKLSQKDIDICVEAANKKLHGKAARNFIDAKLSKLELTEKQVKDLYKIDYSRVFCGTLEQITQWENGNFPLKQTDHRIVETLVDLKYRGDLKPNTWNGIKEAVKANDVKKLRDLLSNNKVWNLDSLEEGEQNRFKKRVEHLQP